MHFTHPSLTSIPTLSLVLTGMSYQIFSSTISVFTEIFCFSHCLIDKVNIINYLLTLCTFLLFFFQIHFSSSWNTSFKSIVKEGFCRKKLPENIFVLLSCLIDHFTCIWHSRFKIIFFQHFETIMQLCFWCCCWEIWCQSNSWFFLRVIRLYSWKLLEFSFVFVLLGFL